MHKFKKGRMVSGVYYEERANISILSPTPPLKATFTSLQLQNHHLIIKVMRVREYDIIIWRIHKKGVRI